MTTKDKIARRKLRLLELASELSNVSRASKVMGYSRKQFYEIRRNFQTYGAKGWLYIAAVIDLFSRRVVGWSMKAKMTSQLVTDALMMAIWRRGKPDA